MVKFSFGRRKRDSATGKLHSVGNTIGAALFFLFFFGMGMAFEVLTIREFGRAIGQRFWNHTPCTILASNIEEKPRSKNPYTFTVTYEYEFNSAGYTSTTYKRSYSGSDEYHKADSIAKRYPQGKDAFCYVNPNEPSKAVIKRGSLLVGFFILFPLIFVLIGVGGIYGLFFARRKKAKAKPIAVKSRRRKSGNKVGVGILAIFALAGAGMLYPLTIRPIAKTLDARNWIETPCKIISARVKTHEGDDSDTYSIDIFYEYQFDGKLYKSSRYGFIGGSSSGRSGKAEVVNAYKKAENPACYVNPKDPSEAVLKRGLRLGLLLCLFPLLFLAIGVGGIVHLIRSKKKRNLRPAAKQRPGKTRLASTFDFSLADDAVSGPVVLNTRHSPLAKLLIIIAVAAIWNGAISIFVYQAIKDFQQSRLQSGMTFYKLIPFILIGLAAIVFVFHQLLALFNPRVKLKLSSATIPLGGAAELSWAVSGRRGVIESLKITLQAREETRRRRGKKTYTDTNVFYETQLYSTTHMGEIAGGSMGIVMPSHTMHSFEAANNKIIWELKVHGEVKRWPDVNETFKIRISPQAD